jgi:hypothetical protein
MAIVIKEIQVKTTVERPIRSPEMPDEALRKLRRSILNEVSDAMRKQAENRKGR